MKLETLFTFEKKYNLHNRKILNINYWDFCRMNIFYELKSKYEGTNKVADICKKTKLKDYYIKQNKTKSGYKSIKKRLILLKTQ